MESCRDSNADGFHALVARAIGRWKVPGLLPLQELVVYQILCAGGLLDTPDAAEEPPYRIVVFPTGTGKTLCFALPVSLLQGPTLVVYPLRSLIADQERRFRDAGLDPLVLQGHQDHSLREAGLQRLASGACSVVLATLETLLGKGMLERLSRISWAHLVFDEAHVIPQWGQSFRQAYDEADRILDCLQPVQCTACTATADLEILGRLRALLSRKPCREILLNPCRPNLEYRVIPSPEPSRTISCLLQGAGMPRISFPCIVFIRDRKHCERMASRLNRILGPRVRFYHAGLEPDEKTRTEHWFRHARDGILFSTNAFGLGVDHPGIRTVLHHNLPDTMASWVQEAGRGGRDGLAAKAWVVQDPGKGVDDPFLRDLLRTKTCRQMALSAAFGHQVGACGTCDVCRRDVWHLPPEEAWVAAMVAALPGRHLPGDLAGNPAGPSRIMGIQRTAGMIHHMMARGLIRSSRFPLSWNRLVPGNVANPD